MKFVRISILLTLAIFQSLLSQQTRLAPNTANKHDERGISTASSLFSESNEVIGDFDGNLSYVVPFKMDLQTELAVSMTLTYNSNTEHRVFTKLDDGSVDRNTGYSVNAPEWIIGINGIAIQTLNFEMNYYLCTSGSLLQAYGLQGREIPRLIPGYHFTNSLLTVPNNAPKDVIEILKADGSKITLYKRWENSNSNYYQGIYYEGGINNKGYAIVKSVGGASVPFPRKMWYKPGDGLTYYFEEETVKYTVIDDFMYVITCPKIMYLKSISSPTETLYINYSYPVYNPKINGTNLGRKYATEITVGNKVVGGISYQLDQLGGGNNITMGAYQSGGLTLNLKNIESDTLLSFSRRNSIGASAIQTIASISDAEGRKTVFEYTNALRNYRYRSSTNACDGGTGFCFSAPNYIISSITNSAGRKAVFEYQNDYNLNLTNGYYQFSFAIDATNYSNVDKVKSTYRDNYTNFMVKKRSVYENTNASSPILKREDSYSYIWGTGTHSILDYEQFAKADDIKTTIQISDKVNSENRYIVKNFSRIKNRTSAVTGSGMASSTVLVSEETKSSATSTFKLLKTINTDIGSLMGTAPDQYYSGTFLPTGSVDAFYNNGSLIDQKSTSISYSDYQYLFGDNSSSEGKFIPKKRYVTDPNNLTTESEINISNIPSSAPSFPGTTENETYYYNTGMLYLETVKNGTTIKNQKRMDYYTTGDLKGKLYCVFNNYHTTTPDTVTFEYITSPADPFYKGLISKKTYSANVRWEEFYYPIPQTTTGDYSAKAPGYFSTIGGQRNAKDFYQTYYQRKPFRTVLNFLKNGSIESLTSYTAYDERGALAFQVDQNGSYSEYFTDGLKRPTLASLPGCFFDQGTIAPRLISQLGQNTYKYRYLDIGVSPKNVAEVTLRQLYNTQTTPLELVTQYHYDVFGNLDTTKVKTNGVGGVDATGDTWEVKQSASYNSLGQKLSETDGEGRTKRFTYDFLGRLTKIDYMVSGSIAASKLFTFNGFNQVTSTDELSKTVTTNYDNGGNITSESKADGLGNTLNTQFAYNTLKQLYTVTTPASKVTSYLYDAMGNVNQKTTPDEGTVKYTYDKFSNLRFSYNTDAGSSEKMIFTRYDALNRIAATGTKTTTLSEFNALNPNAAQTFETDTAYLVTVNMYDTYQKTGVFAVMSDPLDNNETYFNTNGYLKGQLAATAFRDKPGDPWNYKVYMYDCNGRIAQYFVYSKNQYWNVIQNTYDNKGDVIKQSVDNYPDALAVNCSFFNWYDFDRQGRLYQVRTNRTDNKTTAALDATYSYKLDNQLSQLTYNALNNSATTLTYEYSSRGWLGRISNTAGFKEQNTYNNDGTISAQLFQYPSSLGWGQYNFTYAYDNIKRLSSSTCTQDAAKTETFTYNMDGNLMTKNRTGKNITYTPVTGKNQLASITINNGTPITYTYNTKGNITYDGNKGITNFIYDHRNLPLGVTASSVAYTYSYDDKGNRIQKRSASLNEYYLLDHTGRELACYNAATGELKSLNLYGSGVLGRVQVTWSGSTRTDTKYYYIKDHLGSIKMTLGAGGSIAAARDYYPFGETLREYQSGVTDRFKFTEKERDNETNYDYFGARYYDSELGRWMTVDPLAGKYPSLSPYNYCLNNPIILIDLKGEEVWTTDLYKLNEDGSYVNPEAVKAFEIFAKSKEGQAFLAKFAKAGQTIAGIKYSKSGIYHKEGINLAYDRPAQMRSGVNGQTYEIGSSIHIRLSEERINEGSFYNMVQTIMHESFIHGILDAEDYMGDHQFNYSIMNKNTDPYNPHHVLVKGEEYRQQYFYQNGFPLMERLNGIYHVYKNRQEVINAMYGFRE